MDFGIVFWCIMSTFCFFLLLYSKFEKLRKAIEHYGFRIIAEIAVESIDEKRVAKKFKMLMREAIREELSSIKIKELDSNDKSTNTKT